MQIPIIFEDSKFLAINKPSGIIVNRSINAKENTIQDWAEEKLKVKCQKFKVDSDSDFLKRAGIVHRLDKDTSGLLLIAKDEDAFLFLQHQFSQRFVEKKYLTLVFGRVTPKVGEINSPVGRLPKNRRKFGVILGGREALTNYQVVDYYQKEKEYFSLIEVFPKTGRTHQIRIHFKHIGSPVVGDRLYSGRKRFVKYKSLCNRLFLHASFLKFTHPKTKKKMTLESKLPEELSRVLENLQKSC